MAGHGHIKIKLSTGQHKALLTACTFAITNYKIETDEEWLYLFKLREFRNGLLKKTLSRQKAYSVTFDEADTIWFWLLWMRIDLKDFLPYEQVVMQDIINKVDKHKISITAKGITYEEPEE